MKPGKYDVFYAATILKHTQPSAMCSGIMVGKVFNTAQEMWEACTASVKQSSEPGTDVVITAMSVLSFEELP